MKAYQVQARPWQRCQPLHELQRRHHDVRSAVAVRCFEFENGLPCVVDTQPFVGLSLTIAGRVT